LRRDRDADRREARGDRVVRAPVPGATVILEVGDGIDATRQGGGELSKRREREVVTLQRECAADLRRLLALERRIDREMALALQRDALAVEPPREDHQA